MNKKISTIIAALLAILLLCAGCAKNPNQVTENGVSRAEASGESAGKAAASGRAQENSIPEILASTPKEVKKRYATKNTVINIDAKVVVPKTDRLYTGKLKWLESADEKKILQKLVSEDPVAQPIDKYSLTVAGDTPGEFYYENSAVNNMYPENVEPKAAEHPQIRMTPEQAVSAVEELMGRTGLGEFAAESPHLQINHGGDRDGKGVYSLWVTPKLYGVPLYIDWLRTSGFAVGANALVVDEGVALIGGQLCVEAYDTEEVPAIFSLEQAMDVVERSLDLYVSGKPDNSVQTIALQYLPKATEEGTEFVPCWCFEYEKMDLSAKNWGQDIFVNAVTGQIER